MGLFSRKKPDSGPQTIAPETGVLRNVFGDEALPPAPPDATLYTFDNGEYKPQMDILYPPGTKFYFKHEDGTYYDSDIEIGTDVVDETSVAITEEFMIEKFTEFLRAHGFSVVPAGEVPTQSVKIEISMGMAKLKKLISSHTTNHAAIDEANAIISKIEQYL